MKSINKIHAYDLICNSKGNSFTAKYIKSNGKERLINCRIKTKVGINGKGMKYNPIEKGLIPVFDLQLARKLKDKKLCYRSINLLTLQYLAIDNNKYLVI